MNKEYRSTGHLAEKVWMVLPGVTGHEADHVEG